MDVEAARIYENLFVPALFGQFSTRIADALELQPGDAVLDVACGTGAFAREAQRFVQPTGRVYGVDTSEGMLTVAQETAPAVEFALQPAESLSFSGDSFDAVVSLFGLMFFQDRTAALREMHRVCKPGGKIVVAVWESLDQIRAYVDVVDLVDEVMGKGSGEHLRAPFCLGDVNEVTALFRDAGMPCVEHAVFSGWERFDSIDSWLIADVKGWLPIGTTYTEEQFQEILKRGRVSLMTHCTSAGAVRFPVHAYVYSVAA